MRSAASVAEIVAGKATIWVRGVITSRAFFWLNSNTPSIMRASCAPRLPVFRDCCTSMRISSGECTRSRSLIGLAPSRRSSPVAELLSNQMNGLVTMVNTTSGRANHRPNTSG